MGYEPRTRKSTDVGSATRPHGARFDPRRGALGDPHEEQDVKVPWHFWVLLVAAGLYLVWRIVQMISWAVT
jgi:hypothetical protein